MIFFFQIENLGDSCSGNDRCGIRQECNGGVCKCKPLYENDPSNPKNCRIKNSEMKNLHENCSEGEQCVKGDLF